MTTERKSTKSIKLYVKSIDGVCWYVGDEPCRPERGINFQLGRYFYAATAWTASENFKHARRYARALVFASELHKFEIADYGMNESCKTH